MLLTSHHPIMRIVPRILAPASQVASRLSRFGTKNILSMRHASGPRALRSAEGHELDVALANTAVSAPFYVAGSQRLREPLKLFLTGAKAAAHTTASQCSNGVNYGKAIGIGAGGLQEDALQALLQVGPKDAACPSFPIPAASAALGGACTSAAATCTTLQHWEQKRT